MKKRPNLQKPAPIKVSEIQNSNEGVTITTEKLQNFFSRPQITGNFNPEDLTVMGDLGNGNEGSVTKVRHIPTNLVLARKTIQLEISLAERSRIMQELEVLKDCNSPYIVRYFGAVYRTGQLNLYMEYMDGRSLDWLLQIVHRIPENILGKVTISVIKGLTYLRDSHNIMHRDIKPSNILVNSHGQIKLCDFGVSGQLINSLAQSFVGTSHYMAPERIQGKEYAVESDIWSLGLTLAELALGVYPIPPEDPIKMYEGQRSFDKRDFPIFALIESIVNEPPPTIPGSPIFSDEFKDFIDRCLRKVPKDRFDLRTIVHHPFIPLSEMRHVEVDLWVCQVCSGSVNP